MPTSPVNRASAASAIAALLGQAMSGQAQSAAARRRASEGVSAGKAGGSGKSSSGKGASSASAADGQSPLADLIVHRAKGLNPDASDYRSRLLRLVIEASLLHEFGGNLLNAPKFQFMVDQVLHELEHSPQLSKHISTVMDALATRHSP